MVLEVLPPMSWSLGQTFISWKRDLSTVSGLAVVLALCMPDTDSPPLSSIQIPPSYRRHPSTADNLRKLRRGTRLLTTRYSCVLGDRSDKGRADPDEFAFQTNCERRDASETVIC